jgi:CheY-like chemotaxis protein
MSKRVLVVDDHKPTRALVRAILESEKTDKFEVVEAENGQECLDRLSDAGPFHLVLLDVSMPVMDGYDTCRAIREHHKTVPVVFVTANREMKDYAAGRDAGGDSYIVKPVARAALRSIVQLFTSVGRRSA